MPKTKTITLKFVRIPLTWSVVALSNIGELNPGDLINRDYRDRLLADENCTVDIISADILGTIVRNLPIPFLGKARIAKMQAKTKGPPPLQKP